MKYSFTHLKSVKTAFSFNKFFETVDIKSCDLFWVTKPARKRQQSSTMQIKTIPNLDWTLDASELFKKNKTKPCLNHNSKHATYGSLLITTNLLFSIFLCALCLAVVTKLSSAVERSFGLEVLLQVHLLVCVPSN